MQPLTFRSRKWTLSSPKEPSKVGHGWNLYVVDTVTPLALYQEMVKSHSWMMELTNPNLVYYYH